MLGAQGEDSRGRKGQGRPRRLAEEAPGPPAGKRSTVRKATAVVPILLNYSYTHLASHQKTSYTPY
ncbi:hypothetical protein FZC76_06150 [Sutcliffiella horikoshii]|uniref:Uncharacterized protein n=1 Tax=Sutcliffiella horikoshii TaxID=79883 RepID=A0A5D4T551_9BACI|nr:hypothetical protein FZC76_06150 [Sutcliffiella horikoshii]